MCPCACLIAGQPGPGLPVLQTTKAVLMDALHVAKSTDPTSTSGRAVMMLSVLAKDLSRVPVALGVMAREVCIHWIALPVPLCPERLNWDLWHRTVTRGVLSRMFQDKLHIKEFLGRVVAHACDKLYEDCRVNFLSILLIMIDDNLAGTFSCV
jgi:hypothetical protein